MPQNKPDPGTITWDAPPETVPPQQGSRQGGVIITDPTVASGERRAEEQLDISASSQQTTRAGSTWRTMTPEEAAQQGLPVGGVYQVNQLGEVRTVQAAPKSKDLTSGELSEKKDLATALDQFESDLVYLEDEYKDLFKEQGLATPLEFIPTNRKRAFDDAGTRLLPIVAKALGFTAKQMDTPAEIERLKTYVPQSWDSDDQIERKLEVLRGMLTRQRANITEQIGERESPLAPTGEGADPEITGEGETFLTPEDVEMQGRLREAYQGGASLEELQAISGEYNRSFPIGTQEELDAARQQGRAINVQPSGVRTEAGKLLGSAAESEAGAYAVAAANGLLSGGLDELAPVLGLDADTVQAAKEMLREKYPASSFVGEASGQAMQLALTRGAGGPGSLAAREAGQGALYGAGESNDNRLTGAAVGAGATVVGQQIGKRLLEPAAQRAIERVAANSGVPKEAVEDVIREVSEQPLAGDVAEETGTIARQALGVGPKAKAAREKLAIMAQVNPEAKAAAERLGMELPIDILSDDARLMTVTGLARSQIGSDAQDAWGQTVSRTINQTDETLQEIGASPDIAQVGADVMDRLTQNIDSLERQGATLRREVDDAIDVRDRVDAGNLQDAMAGVINDMGGLADAKQAFSAEERKLFDMLGEGAVAKKPTYARLNQMRDQIGKALFKGQGPWADTAQANLAKYYKALADDQLDYVEQVGGKELADKMRGSNDLFSKMYDARRSMQTVYGSKLEKDLPPLINRAIAKAQKGDAQDLRKLMDAVPEDMRPQVLLSGIMAASQRKSAQGGFSFAQYAKMYRGLRQNAPVYKQVAETVGPQAAQVMQDIYSISRRMASGEDKIIRTGASNQPLINALNAESFLAKVMGGTARRTAVTAAAAGTGGVMGGPLGGALGASVSEATQEAISKGGKTRLDKLHGLLSSDAFKGLVEKVGTGEETRGAVNRIVGDKAYTNFAARVLGLKTPEQRRAWIEDAIKGTAVAGSATQTRPEQQPTSTIEVR